MSRLGPKRTAWRTTALCLLALCASLIVCGQVVSELPLKISGRVVAAGTGTPVPDALVAIESSTTMPLDDPGLNSYVRTDAEGRFTTGARGVVSLRAWKRGYAMRDLLLGKAWRLKWKEVTVELRELSAGKPVEEVTNRYGLEPGEGLVLSTGEVVSADSPAADLRLVTDSGTSAPLVEALGEGGLLYQPYEGEVDYYNTPEAPASGYARRLPLPDAMGLFFVRTRDGRHYGKVRFIPGDGRAGDGRRGRNYWFQWSYQPDGTRSLEVAPSRAMPFPFHRFGLNASSLGSAPGEGVKSQRRIRSRASLTG